MNLSNLVKTGVIARPQRGIIYGPKAVGKTSLVAGMEGAVIIDTEAGSHQYPCPRINVGNYQQLDTAIGALLNEPNNYRTIIIDTIDWAEEYLRAEVCRMKGVSDMGDFAHGRGYILWRDKFTDFLLALNGFIRLGKHVILVGHSQIKTVSFPGLDPYDRHELKLDKRNVETATEWADFQLFLNWDIRTIKTKDGTIRARGSNERFVYSVNDLAYDAKNRLGIIEPLKLEPASLACFLAEAPVSTPISAPALSSVLDTPQTSPPPAGTPAPVFQEISVQQKLKEALRAIHEDWITDFLVDRRKIVAGQTVLDAPAAYCEDALTRISEFREAIIKFGQERDEIVV